jgi:Methyltransferase domain
MTHPALRDRPCPLCGSRDAAPEVRSRRQAEFRTIDDLRPFWFGIDKERRFFTYHRCGECGLLYNQVFFDDDQLGALYGAMPPNMDLVPDAAIVATQRGYFDAVAGRTALAGGYLELGPDVGHVVAEAATRGSFDHFWLFEPNRAVHDRLRAATMGRPARILTDMTDLSAVPDGSIGLAVAVHVLDHLLDPLAMLSAVRAKLRPGGMMMLVTHDERSALRRVLGARWPAFCLQHPELYNPATLQALLARAGFADVAVTPSANHFPIDFLARQAARAIGVPAIARLPLPKRAVRLRLGNLLTVAVAPDQAAAERTLFESAA